MVELTTTSHPAMTFRNAGWLYGTDFQYYIVNLADTHAATGGKTKGVILN